MPYIGGLETTQARVWPSKPKKLCHVRRQADRAMACRWRHELSHVCPDKVTWQSLLRQIIKRYNSLLKDIRRDLWVRPWVRGMSKTHGLWERAMSKPPPFTPIPPCRWALLFWLRENNTPDLFDMHFICFAIFIKHVDEFSQYFVTYFVTGLKGLTGRLIRFVTRVWAARVLFSNAEYTWSWRKCLSTWIQTNKKHSYYAQNVSDNVSGNFPERIRKLPECLPSTVRSKLNTR